MSVFKCKMCGGALEVTGNESVVTCEYCGTKQTLPKLTDDRRTNLYDRANHFRRNNDFDKAQGIYEQILNEDPEDAEAYWSIVLCRYGIEYVEDPSSHKRIPTVNRAQYTSVFDDEDYKSAISHADTEQKSVYEAEAHTINEIQKGILEISQKEEPFDVFICYKETDANGRRTQDSVLANDLYHQLVQEGFKVFFSRITLEDKLGTAYEPYIFAALNSAKVMVVLGTRPEYFNAVWVKNEWSRYLALIKAGQKKVLVPAYRDMDPYDLPEEFSHLQAQDMSKLGFMQDLIRGIKKIMEAETPKETVKETVIVNSQTTANTNIAPLLERVFLFLEDGKWHDADIYCEKVLDIDPKNADAYLGKLMAELQVNTRKELQDCKIPFNDCDNYNKVLRFGDEELEEELLGYINHINERNELERKTDIYNKAVNAMNRANTEQGFKDAAHSFQGISGFRDADTLAKQCIERAEEDRLKAERAAKRKKKALVIIAICLVAVIIVIKVILPMIKNAKMHDYTCAEVGDCIYYGSYEQDNNTSNGKEEIEWIVLDKENDKILVISKYALDCQQYNTSRVDVTWESCSLRKWMNETFLSTAFTVEEQERIATVAVTADGNPKYSTSAGNDTQNQIFLLSVAETEKYFSSDSERKCNTTAYAKAQGGYSTGGNCWWWLRSPGYGSDNAAYVNRDGSISYDGDYVNFANDCVRPALWINLEP